MGAVGPLPNDERLLTLVVTEDRERVDRECNDVPALGILVGCHLSRWIAFEDGSAVQAVKIVRYTDRLPSTMAFEIEAHELCHTVASLQSIHDPCHEEDGGLLRSAPAPALGISWR